MTKHPLFHIAKYLLAVGLLTWVIWANWAPAPAGPDQEPPKGLGYVWERHVVEGQPIHLGFLIAAVFLYSFAVFITLVRWYLLVQALELDLSFRNAHRYGLIGLFFNAFLPGSVGGDLVKAAVLAKGQKRRTAAVASVIMDRAIALWAIVWFVAVFGSIFWLTGMVEGETAVAVELIISVALGIVAASVLVWVALGFLPEHRAQRFAGRLLWLPIVGKSASEFWLSVWMYRKRQKMVAFVMVLTCVGQLGFVSAFYCCANTLWAPELGTVPPWWQHFLLVPCGLIGQAFIPTPGGAGGGEWVFAMLYTIFGAAAVNGLLGCLVLRILAWGTGIVGYGVYLGARADLPAEPTPVAGEVTTAAVRPEASLAG